MAEVFKEHHGTSVWLHLNNPKAMNALTPAIVNSLDLELKAAAKDEAVSVIVITGAGEAFCAGADLKGVPDPSDVPDGKPDFYDLSDQMFDRLRNIEKPTIAAINGITLAGGLELALACDLIVAVEDASIGDGHANFGVFPGAGGASTLARNLPTAVAKYLLFTGNTMSSQELHALGLINEVHSADDFLQRVQELTELISSKSPLGLARMKQAVNSATGRSLNDSIAAETLLFRKHLRSADMREGLAAFAEKRKPHFTGR